MTEGVPKPDDEPTSCPDNTSFTFIGPRLPTLLVSPWIPKGTVVHDPDAPVGTPGRPTNTSKFEHSSILATVEELFGLPPLTRRDAWAASLLPILTLDEPRVDTPAILPDAPPPTRGAAVHGCGDENELTRRHKRRIRHFASYVDGLDDAAVDSFIQTMLRKPADAEAWINRKAQDALAAARRLTSSSAEADL